MDLTDAQWERVRARLTDSYKGVGRKRQDTRPILDGILWILRTGAP